MIRERIANLKNDVQLSEVIRGSSWAMGTKVLAMLFGYGFTLLISNMFGARVVGLFNLSFAVVSMASAPVPFACFSMVLRSSVAYLW